MTVPWAYSVAKLKTVTGNLWKVLTVFAASFGKCNCLCLFVGDQEVRTFLLLLASIVTESAFMAVTEIAHTLCSIYLEHIASGLLL